MTATQALNGRHRRVPAPSTNGCNGHPAPQPTPAEGRDAQTGRFTRGWKGGPGNPFAHAVAARRQALLDAISPGDLAAVAKALLRQALAGDAAAAKVLLAYTVGRPAEMVDPDRLDVDEFRLAAESPHVHDLFDMHERLAPAFAARAAMCRQARDDLTYRRLLMTLFHKAVKREYGPEVAAIVAAEAEELDPERGVRSGPGAAPDSPPESP
jgi:hypothetical protein